MKNLNDTITFRSGASINCRIVQTPMLTNSGVNEMASEDTIQYYNARSKSAGMVIVEYTNVSPNGGPSRSWAEDREQLAIYDDKFIPGLKKIAEGLKKDGNKALLQLVHSGREAEYAAKIGRRCEVPSLVNYPWIDYPLHELTEEETWQIVKDFGEGTRRAIECGFDGVEIHGANHYLIQEFFSAFSNIRNDFWGGSLEKRMNFPLEVAREVFRVVKECAPENFIVGYRISPEEVHGPNIGYTWREAQQLVTKLTEEFPFDYIHYSTLNYAGAPTDPESEGMTESLAQLMNKAVKGEAKTIVAGWIYGLDAVKDALNHADLVGLGRMTLIDPEIGDKIVNGRENEISLSYNDEVFKKAHLTQGLIEMLAQTPDFQTPGMNMEYLKNLSKEDLGYAVTHTGTNDPQE